MTEENAYALVFDFGSSCIKACIGQNQEGRMKMLAVVKRPITSEIRRGLIQKTQEVSSLVNGMIEELQEKLGFPVKILKSYVGVNAYGMRSLPMKAALELNYERVVDDVLLDELFDEAMSKFQENEEYDSRNTFVQEYVVDGFRTMDPGGESPKKIEAYYKVVTGRNQIFRNLENVLEQTLLKDTYAMELGVIASAEAVLSVEDKEKGVVVVDFGAETTGICVIKDDVVRHVAILPFGGQNITRDLTQISGLSLQEAEALKLEKGNALHYTELMMRVKKENGRQLEFSAADKEVNEIVVARIEEIVDNIWAQIRYAWPTPSTLANGIVITGGASQLKNLVNLLHQKSNLQVRLSQVDPEMAQCMGLLRLAKENCLQAMEAPKEETYVESNLFAEEETLETPEDVFVEFKSEDKPLKKDSPQKDSPEEKQNKRPQKQHKVGFLKNLSKNLFDTLTDDN